MTRYVALRNNVVLTSTSDGAAVFTRPLPTDAGLVPTFADAADLNAHLDTYVPNMAATVRAGISAIPVTVASTLATPAELAGIWA